MSLRIRYDPKEKVFYRAGSHMGLEQSERYGTFAELVERMAGDLEDVDFTGFDFEGVDVGRYDLSKSLVPSSTLKTLGLYDDSFRQGIVSKMAVTRYTNTSDADSTVPDYGVVRFDETNDTGGRTEARVFYISDIHLDEKILKRFPGPVTRNEIRAYIDEVVEVLHDDYVKACGLHHGWVLVAGDVSHSFEIVRMFFESFVKFFSYTRPIAVLGNHELWDYPRHSPESDPERRLVICIEDYESMFDELHISFVHNMLYSVTEREFVRCDELMKATNDEIREFCNRSKLLILGGIGFAGLNDAINYNSGLYRDTLFSREQEIEESDRFRALHDRLLEAAPDIPMIVLTHMPMSNWSKGRPNPGWIYVSGHTHRNGLVQTDSSTEYFDNQIGYKNTSIHLKSFLTSCCYDLFRDYPDGIHQITSQQYRDFYRGVRVGMTFNRNGDINLLKREGLCCFILVNQDGRPYMLNGGHVKKLPVWDVQYYYDRMTDYSRSVSAFVSNYRKKLEEISGVVRSIGGDGRIHGLIVDISFYSHLFLNPLDGSVIPYYAASMVDKTVYKDVPTLLKECEMPLLEPFKSRLSSDSEALAPLGTNPSFDGDSIEYRETWMYRCSNMFRRFQYLTDLHIIREWRDELLTNPQSQDDLALDVLGIRSLKEAKE